MSEENKLLKNTTGLLIVENLEKLAAVQMAEAAQQAAELTPEDFQKLVRAGVAKWLYPIGTIIVINWTDKRDGTVYQVPHIVAHHGYATLADGEVVPSCTLVWKYCTPYDIQFSNYQAMYYSETGEPADTYYFNVPSTWGTAVAGKYNFTLTQPIPAGGQIVGPNNMPDVAVANWTVSTYASPTDTTPIETVPVVAGEAGTPLGDFQAAGSATLNSIQRGAYGNNRYAHSAFRQWLNSDAGIGAWWTPANNYDRPPAQLATVPGFLSGYDDDFLAILSPSKVTTALNTVTDSSIGTYEDTYDKVFLPSLEEIYCTPQLADTEGEPWELFKRLLGRTTPAGTGSSNKYDAYKIRAINAPTGSTQYVRLRSALRGYASNVWRVDSAGYVAYSSARYSGRGLPALEIK